MRIRFIKDHKVQQNDGNGPHYKAGEVRDFAGPVARTYALKYIARGYAVEHAEQAAPVVQPEQQPETERAIETERPPQSEVAPVEQPVAEEAPRRGRRQR